MFTLSFDVEPGLDQRKNKRTSMPTYPPLGPPTSNLIDAASSFLSVRPGQFVIVRELTHASERVDIEKNWWLGQVIFCEGWEKHSVLSAAERQIPKWLVHNGPCITSYYVVNSYRIIVPESRLAQRKSAVMSRQKY